jgi:hypothetical protein
LTSTSKFPIVNRRHSDDPDPERREGEGEEKILSQAGWGILRLSAPTGQNRVSATPDAAQNDDSVFLVYTYRETALTLTKNRLYIQDSRFWGNSMPVVV